MPQEIAVVDGDIEGAAIETAPHWFEEALARTPESRFVSVKGARIHYLRWGDPAKPGLLFTHGNGAHAYWWAFIAPFLADDYCVAAIDLSGMGDSEHRDHYAIDLFAEEQFAVAEDAGFFASGHKPVFVGHSFGGFVTISAAANAGERLAAAVIVDSPVRPPGQEMKRPERRGGRPHFVYRDADQAMKRFKLAPPQYCENHFIVDYIGRLSLKEVENGVSWKFDPSLWSRFEGSDSTEALSRVRCPLALMRGAYSVLVTPEVDAYMASLPPETPPRVTVPLARHHIMLDQPIAFVGALRGLLAGWPRSV